MTLAKTTEERKALIESVLKMTEEDLKVLIDNQIVVTVDNHQLSLKNTAILLGQLDKVTVVGGYKQWSSAGRQVRKGEKALWITAPVFSEDKKTIKRWIEVKVFDITQTDKV